jgi:glycerol uptake facilitator-like aquaporin
VLRLHPGVGRALLLTVSDLAAEVELGTPSVAVGRRLTAEFVGTALLVAVVVGSGICAQRLSADPGLQLLENAAATGAGLVALILAFGEISGARFNPLVTATAVLDGRLAARHAPAEVAVQIAGAVLGAVAANAMFDLDLVTISDHARVTNGTLLAEVLATFGLITIICGVVRSTNAAQTALAVGAYIAAAYWFTSSTSFANPAVTIARTLTDTFSGIAPVSALAFIAAQCVGAAGAIALDRYLHPRTDP